VGGRIVAVEYAFCFRDRYATYLTGFDPDPEWQRYSIGTVTSAEAVQQAIAEGCQVIDFLHGKDAYKMLWAPTEEAVNCRLLLRRRDNARARAMLWLDELPSYRVPVIKAKRLIVQVLQVVRDSIVPVGQKGIHDPAHAG